MTSELGHAVRSVAALTALWVLLWGRLSAANVLSGAVVSAILLVVFPSTVRGPVGRPRPVAVCRLLVHVTWQLVASNVTVSREVVTRGSRIRTGIVACRLRTESESTVAFLANVLALSPGIMPVHVQTDPPAIYVHVLHLADPDDVRRRVGHLEFLTVRAFGSAADVERLQRRVPRRFAGLHAIDDALDGRGR